MPATKIVVNIPGEIPYDVRVGAAILDGLGSYLKKVPDLKRVKRVLLITDSNVEPLYGEEARSSLGDGGYRVDSITVPAGESSKSVEVVSEIWEAMANLSLGRDCAVVALGGGVVGDLAGFAASTYMRGVPVVQVPTTLLAMVDSSVGGKTGVNLSAGKNLVGTFKQPSYVCAPTTTLLTLPEREWACGCAEIVKSAIIDSDEFFFWLSDEADLLAVRDDAVVTQAIVRSVVFKADVVAEDKTESRGVRECLNFGHTLGHAIEKLTGFGTYSHGQAVAEGMRFAAHFGAEWFDTPSELAYALDELLDRLRLPTLALALDPPAVLEAMKHDKKNRGGEVRFVLLSDVGAWEIHAVDDAVLLPALTSWFLGKS